MDSKKVLLEELSKINKLIAFKPGQLISELGLPGLPQPQNQERQTNINNIYSKVDLQGVIRNPGSAFDGKTWNSYVSTYSVTGDEIEKAKAATQPKTPQIPSELKDTNGVKTFQDWLDQNKPGWATGFPEGKLNRNRGYGRFGPRTSKAWSSYKTEYTSGTVQNPNVIPGSEIGSGEPYYNPEAPAQSAPVPAAGTPAAGTPAVVPDANAVQLPNDQQIPSNPDDIKINGL